MKRTPLKRKPTKRKDADPAYIADLHDRPCIVCDAYGLQQLSPTQAHHTIMGRGGNLRTPDRHAIPLCEGHHMGDFDTSKIALHREPAAWREAYGLDTDYIAVTLDAVDAMRNSV